LLIGYGFAQAQQVPNKKKSEFTQNKVIAHRGAWKNTNAPQNSIASLQTAINLGVTGSEFDIHMTGEIDIMEHVGFDADSVFGTIHTEAYNHMRGTQKGKKVLIRNPYDEFHLYGIEWTPEKIDFFLDGKVYNRVVNEHKTKSEWPFDDPFYLIINVAVGGNLGGKHGIDGTIFPSTMEVDFIRVFKN
jgi:beta-glucanase (GH16 family)